MKTGKIVAISVSKRKGEKKKNVTEAFLIEDRGIQNDGHAEGGQRQVSLLMDESIEKVKTRGIEVSYGDFAENIVTRGIDLPGLKIGDMLKIGGTGELEVTQIGKECPEPCRIFYQVGYCVMPIEGVFCRVLTSGRISVGDEVKIICGGKK